MCQGFSFPSPPDTQKKLTHTRRDVTSERLEQSPHTLSLTRTTPIYANGKTESLTCPRLPLHHGRPDRDALPWRLLPKPIGVGGVCSLSTPSVPPNVDVTLSERRHFQHLDRLSPARWAYVPGLAGVPPSTHHTPTPPLIMSAEGDFDPEAIAKCSHFQLNGTIVILVKMPPRWLFLVWHCSETFLGASITPWSDLKTMTKNCVTTHMSAHFTLNQNRPLRVPVGTKWKVYPYVRNVRIKFTN